MRRSQVLAIRAFLDSPPVARILRLTCFQVCPIAYKFRAAGADIPKKIEDEAAFVYAWMLRLVADHGDEWEKAAALELQTLEAKVKR